ncbi:MAG: aminoacetone oxidase family FAD-binding enzyme, partial [Planctomycetaceae bacterium]|nr:aminoacetone oxidase family FAD-binding enzyme [Planctomycetaceae bacterium]
MSEQADLVVVGAGAAGLFAAIHAGRAGARVVALDGARTLGAKILVAGGGRCNVTHHAVDEKAYAGSSPNAIKNVLRRFGVADTVAFFEAYGVTLKREDTGKLFPTTDDAHTILDALLQAARDAGVDIRHPRRVTEIERTPQGDFLVRGEWGDIHTRRVILATGGKALPKSGSDGAGYEFARALGHTVTKHVFPALVPLILPGTHPLRALSGLTLPATLSLRSSTGKVLKEFTNSLLCTHFGLSGPCALDISRYWRAAILEDAGAGLFASFIAGEREDTLDAKLLASRAANPAAFLREHVPERLARALCEIATVDPAASLRQLTREQRKALARAACALPLSIEGDRGFTYAEVTMGGVPLAEVKLDTMESRACPG